jgi:hypothetical protein
MDEIPYRLVIDLEAAFSKFGDEAAQGEIVFLDPEQQPGAVLSGDCFRLVPAHLARQNAAGFAKPPDPIDHRADPNGKLRGCLSPRSAAFQTAVTTRSRRSREYGRPLHPGLHSSQHGESEKDRFGNPAAKTISL